MKVYAEYIHQVLESQAACCIHKRGEDIVRCGNCQFIKVPLDEKEPIWCGKHGIEVSLKDFCSWGKKRIIKLKVYRNGKWIHCDEYYE